MVITIRKDQSVMDFIYENCCVSTLSKRESVEYDIKWHTGSFTQPSNYMVYQEPEMRQPSMARGSIARSVSQRSQHSQTSTHSTGGLSSSLGALKRRYTQSLVSRSNSVTSVASRAWTSPSRSMSKISISGPSGFRNLTGDFPGDDGAWKDPSAYRSLQLSIHLPSGRLAPLPDFGSEEWTAKAAARLSIPAPAMIKAQSKVSMADINPSMPLKSNPVTNQSRFSEFSTLSRESRQDSMFYDLSAEDFPMIMSASALPHFDSDMPTIVPMDDKMAENPFSGRKSKSFSCSGPVAHGRPQPSLSRTMPDRGRRSASIRRNRLEHVEEENHLNTIAEERRVSAMRPSEDSAAETQSRPDFSQFNFSAAAAQEVEPVRPAMERQPSAVSPMMRARSDSEAMSDMASVFSMPLSIDESMHAESTYPSSAALVSPLLSPQPAALHHSFETRPSRIQQQWAAASHPRTPYGQSSGTFTLDSAALASSTVDGSSPSNATSTTAASPPLSPSAYDLSTPYGIPPSYGLPLHKSQSQTSLDIPSPSPTLSASSTPSNSIPSTPTAMTHFDFDELEQLYQQYNPMQSTTTTTTTTATSTVPSTAVTATARAVAISKANAPLATTVHHHHHHHHHAQPHLRSASDDGNSLFSATSASADAHADGGLAAAGLMTLLPASTYMPAPAKLPRSKQGRERAAVRRTESAEETGTVGSVGVAF